MGTKGLPYLIANSFAKLRPTSKSIANPGPYVHAIYSILSIDTFAFLSASSYTIGRFFSCSLLAISGTTPPHLV